MRRQQHRPPKARNQLRPTQIDSRAPMPDALAQMAPWALIPFVGTATLVALESWRRRRGRRRPGARQREGSGQTPAGGFPDSWAAAGNFSGKLFKRSTGCLATASRNTRAPRGGGSGWKYN